MMGRDSDSQAGFLERLGRVLGEPREIVHFARVLVRRPPAEDFGSGLKPAERRKPDDLAVRALRAAISKGYNRIDELKTGADFEPLRSREDFKGLIGR